MSESRQTFPYSKSSLIICNALQNIPCALVPTEIWSTNALVIWSWLLGGKIWKMTLKQGYLDTPLLKKKKQKTKETQIY